MYINLKDKADLFNAVIKCMKVNLLDMLSNNVDNQYDYDDKIAEQCDYVRDVIFYQALYFETEPNGLSLSQLITCLRDLACVYIDACDYKNLLCIADLLVDAERKVKE
jgi:hypothetical protein